MGVDLVLGVGALIDEGQLEEGSDVGALGSKSDEDGDVGGVVLGVFAVRVEVDGPLVTSNGEVLAGDVLSDADSFGEGIPFDQELVGPVNRLGHEP